MYTEFTYYPHPLEMSVGDLTIQTLPGLDDMRAAVEANYGVEGDWLYAPNEQRHDMISGAIHQLPFSSRVFGFSKRTHALRHATATDPEHLSFLVWMLGFIYGMRFTDTEAGFLDATPIKVGALHDIVWTGKSESKAIAIVDAFWHKHAGNRRVTKGLTGIVHSLFLSQNPRLLEFEEFIFLYTAIDGCHALGSRMNGKNPLDLGHGMRIANLCTVHNRAVPDWANKAFGSDAVGQNRNDTLHEGLFFDEPLGFEVYGGNQQGQTSRRNILLEMRGLVSRIVCGLVGFNDPSYITSDLDTRQRHGVTL